MTLDCGAQALEAARPAFSQLRLVALIVSGDEIRVAMDQAPFAFRISRATGWAVVDGKVDR
jgi:hypothetical protein